MFECWRLVGRELREYCPKRLRRRGALHAKGVESVEYEGRRKAVRERPRLEVRSSVPEQHDLNIVEAMLPSLDVFFLDAKASMSFDGWKLISFSYQVPNPHAYPAFAWGQLTSCWKLCAGKAACHERIIKNRADPSFGSCTGDFRGLWGFYGGESGRKYVLD